MRNSPVLGGFGRLVGIFVAVLCLPGLAACDGREGGGSRVINNDPGNVRANQYAALLESGFEASESVPETQLCRVHLIDARPSFDQAGNEKLRIYFVLTNHEGVVMSADTCGLPVNECVALISRRSREECRLPDRRSID